MSSDLFAAVVIDGHPRPFHGSTHALARGPVVDAFGDCEDRDERARKALGYLTPAEIGEGESGYEDEVWWCDPYWVRRIEGAEFVAIVREKRWQKIQRNPEGGFDFHDLECEPDLRALAALVESYLAEKLPVRVWCWHSQ